MILRHGFGPFQRDRCKTKKEEKTRNVSDGGDKNTGGQSWVDLEEFECERNQNPGQPGHQLSERHSQEGDQPENDASFPKKSRQPHHDSNAQTICKTKGQFFPKSTVAITLAEFTECHVPYNDCQCLHAGIAPPPRPGGTQQELPSWQWWTQTIQPPTPQQKRSAG